MIKRIKKKAGRKGITWSTAQLKILKKLYPTTDNETICTAINSPEIDTGAIRRKAQKLGLRKENWIWSDADEKYLLKNWAKFTAKQLGLHFKRTPGAASMCHLINPFSG